MKRNLISITVFVFWLVAATPLLAQKKQSASEKAIRDADQEWARVFGAKDLKRAVDFCADNASILGPGAPIVTGKQAIGHLFSEFFALPNFKISWHATKVEVARSGELGYSVGAYEMSFKDPSGQIVNERGKYVTVWKRQANRHWKVIYDIFNSDLPAPAASP
jgi:ketosteroid isomerase-like protein